MIFMPFSHSIKPNENTSACFGVYYSRNATAAVAASVAAVTILMQDMLLPAVSRR